ncbi:MAG: MBL fold metallo-hydrolase [Gammaproteobacteria bacterium]
MTPKPLRRILGLLAAGLAVWATISYATPYYDGSTSDHFDGARFLNPQGTIGKGLLDVIQWRLNAETAAWPESVPLAKTAKPAARVEGSALTVTFVGHATALIQTQGLNILTDPIWSDTAFTVQRVTPPGIAFEDLPKIDIVLVSHSHYDHMDLPTLARLRRDHDPLFVVPLGNDELLHGDDEQMRVQTLDWWQSVAYNDRVRVHAVPVYHWSRRYPFDRNKALWSGFVIETGGGKVYYGGDTGLWDGAFFRQASKRLGPFRLAILPVGAYEPRWFMKDQHVNPAEAVQIHQLLGAPPTLGVHLRTFQLTDEAIDQPEIELKAALHAKRISAKRFFTLPIGGSWSEGGNP